MPAEVTPVATARAPGKVGHARLGDEQDLEAERAQAPAQIHVLVVEVVAVVEAAHFGERLGAQAHEHPRNPIGRERRGSHAVVEPVGSAERLAEERRERRKPARTVLRRAVGGEDERRGERDARLAQSREQRRERIGIEPQVGIHHAEERRPRLAERGVVIRAKALRYIVAQYAQAETSRSCGRERFGQVERQQDLRRHLQMRSEVGEQVGNERAVTMADDGKRDDRVRTTHRDGILARPARMTAQATRQPRMLAVLPSSPSRCRGGA
jgi:hypothetical protein